MCVCVCFFDLFYCYYCYIYKLLLLMLLSLSLSWLLLLLDHLFAAVRVFFAKGFFFFTRCILFIRVIAIFIMYYFSAKSRIMKLPSD